MPIFKSTYLEACAAAIFSAAGAPLEKAQRVADQKVRSNEHVEAAEKGFADQVTSKFRHRLYSIVYGNCIN